MITTINVEALSEINPMFRDGLQLMEKIKALGDYQVLMVGGTPRDILIGRKIHDIDIATDCPINVLEENFKTYDIGKSRDFGIVIIVNGEFSFEVAQFRSEGNYSNGRHPDNVQIVGDFQTDSSRRDFTCNALGLDSSGTIIDYHNGVEDIEKRLVRAVGSPDRRFSEDFVRMLRAVRFVATMDFTLETSTRIAIRRLSPLISQCTPERIAMEIEKAAKNGGEIFAKFIDALSKYRLLSKILPEVDVLHYYYHKLNHHPEGRTVYEHVIKCVKICRGNSPTILLATLLHDVGKAEAFIEIDGYPKYHRHERMGIHIVETICDRFKLSNDVKEAIMFATANHMKFHYLDKMKTSKVARLVSNKNWPVLVEVGRADEFSRGENFKHAGEFDANIKRVEAIKEKWQDKMSRKIPSIISGKMIIDVTGEKPGPIIGALKTIIQDRIIDERINYECYDTLRAIVLEEYAKMR